MASSRIPWRNADRRSQRMHMFTVAGSRAGKGPSTIVPMLLSYEGSVLVIAPRGELANLTARTARRNLGRKSVCWIRS
jgi:type IV secretory pathway TraG/TraD family ATPase VirD4